MLWSLNFICYFCTINFYRFCFFQKANYLNLFFMHLSIIFGLFIGKYVFFLLKNRFVINMLNRQCVYQDSVIHWVYSIWWLVITVYGIKHSPHVSSVCVCVYQIFGLDQYTCVFREFNFIIQQSLSIF